MMTSSLTHSAPLTSRLTAHSQAQQTVATTTLETGAPRSVTIDLRGSERWLFVGKTGSGKSYLAKALLREMSRRGWPIVIVDPSAFWMGADPKWPRTGPGTIDAPRLVTRYDPRLAVQLYVPSIPGWQDAGLDNLMAACLKRGRLVLYFDETNGIVSASQFSAQFARVVTQGRKHQLAVWAATQRPTRVPEILLSQAENWAIFRVITPQDRKKIAEYTGSSVTKQQRLPSFFWFYWNQTQDDATLMAPIPKHGRL
jgi:energy-coupling factor transporter ATP-binding protein EcfA2